MYKTRVENDRRFFEIPTLLPTILLIRKFSRKRSGNIYYILNFSARDFFLLKIKEWEFKFFFWISFKISKAAPFFLIFLKLKLFSSEEKRPKIVLSQCFNFPPGQIEGPQEYFNEQIFRPAKLNFEVKHFTKSNLGILS